MDKYHRDIVHKAVQAAAKRIDGRLPELPSHPGGRIPMAHIYQVIQTVMQCPARECDVGRIPDILAIINDCVEHVDIVDVSSIIRDKYAPQAKRSVDSLDQFFI